MIGCIFVFFFFVTAVFVGFLVLVGNTSRAKAVFKAPPLYYRYGFIVFRSNAEISGDE